MTAIAILRPVLVTLAEPRKISREYWTITWRGPRGESSSGLHYALAAARALAQECGAAEIIEEEAAKAATSAPVIPSLTAGEIRRMREARA